MPGNDHDGHDHDDDDDKPGKPGTARSTTVSTLDQLNAAARNITTLSAQVDTINSTWVDPPNPDKPTAINDCNTLLAQAAHITTLANTFISRLRAT